MAKDGVVDERRGVGVLRDQGIVRGDDGVVVMPGGGEDGHGEGHAEEADVEEGFASDFIDEEHADDGADDVNGGEKDVQFECVLS
jgi:hypothetical protein